jgi:thioredoxin 1
LKISVRVVTSATTRPLQEKNMATVKVDNANFDAEVLKSAEPVVIDFWAEWCGPCKMIGPSLEEISVEMAGKVKIAKINVDDNPELAARYGVRGIPMLAIIKNGEMADQITGARPKSALSAWISSAV